MSGPYNNRTKHHHQNGSEKQKSARTSCAVDESFEHEPEYQCSATTTTTVTKSPALSGPRSAGSGPPPARWVLPAGCGADLRKWWNPAFSIYKPETLWFSHRSGLKLVHGFYGLRSVGSNGSSFRDPEQFDPLRGSTEVQST